MTVTLGPIAQNPGVEATNGTGTKRDAKDWKDIFSSECVARKNSVMQGMHRILAQPGMLSLGPGSPSTAYFPFQNINFEVPRPETLDSDEIPEVRYKVQAGKYDNRNGLSNFDLSIALQYGQGTGSAQFLKYITDHVEIYHNPPYKNWKCVMSGGNTSATDVALRMFVKPGVYLLVEQYTYPTVIETAGPLGYQFACVKMDKYGILPEDLDDVLVNWDQEARKGEKPRLLYTVPTGQNPSGATPPAERRRAVYKVAQKHDLLIIEDDPYYFVQMGVYKSGGAPEPEQERQKSISLDEFRKSLIPSYLSLDVDGRVLRMDSVSKIIVPGARLGWVTASEQIIERMTRAHEVSIQNPSGFSQIALFKLLHDSWDHSGLASWLYNLQAEYTMRRDTLIRACELHLPSDIVSCEPPQAGFFAWISIDWKKHPNSNVKTAQEIEKEIFDEAGRCGTLVVPGTWFLPNVEDRKPEVFFRMTFAASSPDEMKEAIRRLGLAIRTVFGITQA